jgi:hypothetical protein
MAKWYFSRLQLGYPVHVWEGHHCVASPVQHVQLLIMNELPPTPLQPCHATNHLQREAVLHLLSAKRRIKEHGSKIDRFLLAVVKYPVFKGRFWTYVPNRFNVGALSQAITTRQLRTFTRFTATHPKQRTGTGVGSREFNDVYYLIFRFISYQFISSFWLTLKNKANYKGHTHLDGTAFSRISSMIYSIDCVYIYICITTKVLYHNQGQHILWLQGYHPSHGWHSGSGEPTQYRILVCNCAKHVSHLLSIGYWWWKQEFPIQTLVVLSITKPSIYCVSIHIHLLYTLYYCIYIYVYT